MIDTKRKTTTSSLCPSSILQPTPNVNSLTGKLFFDTLKAEGYDRHCGYQAQCSSTCAIPSQAELTMKLLSALGLVVLFLLLFVMMPRIFHDLEETLHRFFGMIQDVLALAQKFLAMVSSNT